MGMNRNQRIAVPASPTIRSPHAKGQAAVEVLIYLGFFMLVFVSLTLLFLTQVNQDVMRRQQTLSQSTAASIAQDFELAMLAGPGFDATFPIPTTIGGKPYELYFNDAGYLYINLTNSNPDASPVMFYFPLATRRFELGCVGTLDPVNCPDNAFGTYRGYDGILHQEWRVGTSDGTLRIAHTVDANGFSILRVS